MHHTGKDIAQIYRRHARTVYKVSYMLLRNAVDAEEATQTAFLKLMQSDMTFRDEEHEKAWLIVTARNHCRNMLKHWWRRMRATLEEADHGLVSGETGHDETLGEVLALPAKYRLPIYFKPVAVPFSAGIPRPGEGRSLGAGSVAKFMNYEGNRYSFVADGRAFELGNLGVEKTQALGMLRYNILEDLQGGGTPGLASRDFATTYLTGGTIYKLPGYDSAFRLAVKHEERFYIAQLSGRTDDSAIPASDYVSLAGLGKLTDRVELLDAPGVKRLNEWADAKDILKLAAELGRSLPAALSGEKLEELAAAQAGGRTCLLRWSLKDGTAIDMPIVPGMSLITIGDGRYELTPTFLDGYTSIANP